jgi:hypothetical protein
LDLEMKSLVAGYWSLVMQCNRTLFVLRSSCIIGGE